MATFSSRKTTSSSNKSSLTTCSPGIDATTSFAPTIPEEIKASISLFHTLSAPAVQQAIDHVLSFLIDYNTASGCYHKVGSIMLKGITESQFVSFLNDLRPHLPSASTASANGSTPSSSSSVAAVDNVERNVAVLFSALYSLLLHVMVNRVKLSTLTQDLKAMNMPLSVTTILCTAIKASRQRLDEHSSSSSSHRVAVTSSGSGSGVLGKAHVQVLCLIVSCFYLFVHITLHYRRLFNHHPIPYHLIPPQPISESHLITDHYLLHHHDQQVPYRRVYPTLERFRWRVDVTIANGSLAKVITIT